MDYLKEFIVIVCVAFIAIVIVVIFLNYLFPERTYCPIINNIPYENSFISVNKLDNPRQYVEIVKNTSEEIIHKNQFVYFTGYVYLASIKGNLPTVSPINSDSKDLGTALNDIGINQVGYILLLK